jgi:hypothetical protein
MFMDWVKELQELFQEQSSDVTRYQPLVNQMEQFWNNVKTAYGYVPSDSGIRLFENSDVRLARAEQKLAAVKLNPAVGMGELMQQVERNLRDWISDNQFGYLMNLEFNEAGIAKATVSGMLSEHASYGTKTKEEVFAEALAVLKNKGFTVFKEKSMAHYWFEDTDNNKMLLENELKHINVKYITYHSKFMRAKEPRIIREYEFRVDVYDLLNIAAKEEKPREVLNADDFRTMSHDVREFFSAYSTIRQMPELTQVCLSVMEGIFANLCKMLKIENETTKEYYARFAEERAKNMRIREIEAEIASISNFKEFSKVVSERLDGIKNLLDKYNFFINAFTIDCYGRATLEVTQSRLGYDNFEGFETFAAFGRADELEILDTDANKKKFETLIPMFEVSEMSLMMKDNHRCIRKVTYTCNRFI